MNLKEAIKLIARFPKNPFGVLDELNVRWELRREQQYVSPPSYQPIELEQLITVIENCLQLDLQGFLLEPDLVEIEESVRQGIQKLLRAKIPFPIIHNGDPRLGKLCYIICRALKPDVFIETGVAYGVTSSFILKALAVNNRGKLFSVDRAPIKRNAAEFIGALVPEELKLNWQLYRGESRKILPALLADIKEVDVFLHDSRHTYKNMSSEFKMVAPFLAKQSVLIADDVNRNIAFEEWVNQTKPAAWATVTEESKESLFGVSIFRN